MSGSKRGSAYRKGVVSSYENNFPEPNVELGEVICKIVGSRGANIFETIPATPTASATAKATATATTTTSRGDCSGASSCVGEANVSGSSSSAPYELVVLPKRFLNLIWVKRNDYVIIERGTEEGSDGGNQRIMYLIKHILGKDQINHLKKAGLWPEKFEDGTHKKGGGYEDDMGMIYASTDPYFDEEEAGEEGEDTSERVPGASAAAEAESS
jgi:hypothetical protein